jgi:hypothetical protein
MSTTVVSCYYNIPSKHSNLKINKYLEWIDNFFKNVKHSNLIIFTNNNSKKIIEKYKRDNMVIIEKELIDFEIYKKYPKIWQSQYNMDQQKYSGRNIYCYLIWNSKINMVLESIKLNYFKSTKFVWCDIGNIRKSDIGFSLDSYPINEKISKNVIDIVCLNEITIEDFNKRDNPFFKDEIRLSGSIIGASVDTWNRFSEIYYDMFKKFVDNNKFIGCDQQIILACYVNYPDLFNLVKPYNNRYDPWFYLYEYYT